MALVAGGGGGGVALPSFAAPPALVPESPFLGGGAGAADGTSILGECFGEGAWDIRAWEQDSDANSLRCVCVALAPTIHAARWDAEAKRPVVVPLRPVAGNPADKNGNDPSIPAHVNFDEDATEKRIRKWFQPDSKARAFGALPSGVSVGDDAVNQSLENNASVSPTTTVDCGHRLLGLQIWEDGNAMNYESRRCGVAIVPRAAETDVDSGVEISIRMPSNGSVKTDDILIEPEDLVAFILAEIRARYVESIDGGPLPAVALAVPAWWGSTRRLAAATAVVRSGSAPIKVASYSLCVAMGVCQRLAQAGEDALPSGLVLVASVNGDSEDVSLINTEASDDPVIQQCYVLAGGYGGPVRTDSGSDLTVTVRRAIEEGNRILGKVDIQAVILEGSAQANHVVEVLSKLGSTNPAVFKAEPGDAAAGLACIIAAESSTQAKISPITDAISAAIGLRNSAASGTGNNQEAPTEELFKRGASVPAVLERTFTRDQLLSGREGVDNVDLEIVQHDADGIWRRCFILSSILKMTGDDGKDYPCESAVVTFNVDASGCIDAHVSDFSSPGYARAKTRRTWYRRFIAIALVILLAMAAYAGSAGGGNAYHIELRPRLVSFLKEHNPAKVREVDEWLQKYEGKESVLIQRLEKKYGARIPNAGNGRERHKRGKEL